MIAVPLVANIGCAGLPVLDEGTAAVIAALGERSVLLKEERYAHKYPYDWRTKLPTIFRATPQVGLVLHCSQGTSHHSDCHSTTCMLGVQQCQAVHRQYLLVVHIFPGKGCCEGTDAQQDCGLPP